MAPQKLYIADIQTSDLLYFDPSIGEACRKFCEQRNIDCLPSLAAPAFFYRRNEAGFSKKEIGPELKIDGGEFIFETSLADRFKASHLLFVYRDQHELSGVVHFSDYNKPIVHEYLFGLLTAYERALRKLLQLHKLTDKQLSTFLSNRSKREGDRDARRAAQLSTAKPDLMPFEDTYLDDLLAFVNAQSAIYLALHEEEVVKLRNMIMHAHELVKKKDTRLSDQIYTVESFTIFFDCAQKLMSDYRQVNNRIAFLRE